MSLISVIVPVYNVEQFLHRCVDSILRQTFTDFELILVDDGSPDNSGEICEEYVKSDVRVRVIHQKNGGLSAARNTGIDWAFVNSDSQWLTFIDSDDWVHETYLEKLLKAATENKVSISLCEFESTNDDKNDNIIKNEDNRVCIISPEEYYVQNNINATIACGKLYLKSCFQSVRYPVGKIHEDEAVTHRILFKFDEIAVVEEVLYSYYVNPEGITRAQWNPRRLDSLVGLEDQISFMKEHGYKVAHKYAIKKSILCIAKYITMIKKNENREYDKYIKFLRFRLKKLLFFNRNTIPFKQNIWIYECAFPVLLSLYWLIKAQYIKIIKQ